MGVRNILVEGVSTSGKTTVAEELERRGYEVLHGDRVLAYTGDLATGRPLELDPAWTPAEAHTHHLWDVDAVLSAAADGTHPVTFFCGGARNNAVLRDVFDVVVVLEVDAETLDRRLAARPADEFGSRPDEAAVVRRVHRTREDVPRGAIPIDATRPLDQVVDDIVAVAGGTSPMPD